MRASLGRVPRRSRGGRAHPEQAKPEEHMNAGNNRGMNSEVTIVVGLSLVGIVEILLDGDGGESNCN